MVSPCFAANSSPLSAMVQCHPRQLWFDRTAPPPYPMARMRTWATPIANAPLGLVGILSLLVWDTSPAASEEPAVRGPQHWDECRSAGVAATPVVYRKGNQLRFYLSDGSWWVALRGTARHPRQPSSDYEFQIVNLNYALQPPPQPEARRGWEKATVITGEEWHSLARLATDRLTPSQPDLGVYFQTVFGDGVLYRDDQGVARVGPVGTLPEGVELSRRYGIHEFEVAFAREVETIMLERNRDDGLICLVPPAKGPHVRYELFDRRDRRAFLCLAPRPARDPTLRASPGASAKDLTGFIVEGHAWAILKNPFSSVGRLLSRARQTVGNLVGPRLRSNKNGFPPVKPGADGMNLRAWESWLDRHTGTKQEKGSVRFLVNGEEFFPVFNDRLRSAKKDIQLLVCIFDNDDVAVEIADILRERSAEIDVAVILDRFSCLSSARSWPITPMPEGFVPPTSIGTYLQKGSKVRVRPFLNTWASAEHSKVYLIDGTHAFLGGMNLGREYRFEWHDLMSEVEGPIVASLQWEFAKAWAHASALGDLAFVSKKFLGERPEPSDDGRDWTMLRRLNTRTKNKSIRQAVLEALRRAEREVFLENPYLFSNEVIKELGRTRKRGVDVRVILGRENNTFGGTGSNVLVANHLLGHGVRVFVYPGMSHVKALYVDGWSTWGSANFNGLSLKNNLEVNLATSEERISDELRAKLFDEDFKASMELIEPLQGRWSDSLSQSLLNQM